MKVYGMKKEVRRIRFRNYYQKLEKLRRVKIPEWRPDNSTVRDMVLEL